MKVTDAQGTRQVAETAVGVIDRTVAVLDAVQHGAVTHSAVVAATGLPRTTAHRLLASLERHALVEHVAGQGYRLGPRLLRLASASLREPSLRAVAAPTLERLAEATGESAQLYVRSTEARVCVAGVESSNELRTFVPLGAELPLWAGSAGKVFMAWTGEPARTELIGRTRRLTPATPTGERLRRQLTTIRRQGWSSSAGEREAGVGSVSAPVLSTPDELVAVVSVSGPASRVTRSGARRLAPAVVTAARAIEEALGMAVN
ncbi:MAG: IclR family transcriptional regulator [Actinomycetota bacterium]